ncbi:N-acetylgalactosamine-6-sulfatase [Colletotrichum shisoi]|uniref:N-acetylgalactosamine-6-sulfatase n=1 Tax=Colletotrichum shisoi TaxID=2078593 RepID=A0A5Q4BD11_9PEZI|nr:N-acetylgalactosamine-6-sulfatase [Colletotrichum shisoi]
MRFQSLTPSLFAASAVTAAIVPQEAVAASAAAVEERDVPCGCLPDYVGNSYGCNGPFPGQNYCQLRGVAGDYAYTHRMPIDTGIASAYRNIIAMKALVHLVGRVILPKQLTANDAAQASLRPWARAFPPLRTPQGGPYSTPAKITDQEKATMYQGPRQRVQSGERDDPQERNDEDAADSVKKVSVHTIVCEGLDERLEGRMDPVGALLLVFGYDASTKDSTFLEGHKVETAVDGGRVSRASGEKDDEGDEDQQSNRPLDCNFQERTRFEAPHGKWHLGDVPGRYPSDRGFDEWFRIPRTTDETQFTSVARFDPEGAEPPHIMRGGAGELSENVCIYDLENRRLIDEMLVARSRDWLSRQVEAEKAFFLCHPLTVQGDFADSMAEMDHRVGEILDHVDDLGIRENTIPGRVPRGVTHNGIVHVTDLFTTILSMTGAADELRAIKGRDWKLHLVWESKVNQSSGRLESPCLVSVVRDPKEEVEILAYNTWVLPAAHVQAESRVPKDPQGRFCAAWFAEGDSEYSRARLRGNGPPLVVEAELDGEPRGEAEEVPRAAQVRGEAAVLRHEENVSEMVEVPGADDGRVQG